MASHFKKATRQTFLKTWVVSIISLLWISCSSPQQMSCHSGSEGPYHSMKAGGYSLLWKTKPEVITANETFKFCVSVRDSQNNIIPGKVFLRTIRTEQDEKIPEGPLWIALWDSTNNYFGAAGRIVRPGNKIIHFQLFDNDKLALEANVPLYVKQQENEEHQRHEIPSVEHGNGGGSCH